MCREHITDTRSAPRIQNQHTTPKNAHSNHLKLTRKDPHLPLFTHYAPTLCGFQNTPLGSTSAFTPSNLLYTSSP